MAFKGTKSILLDKHVYFFENFVRAYKKNFNASIFYHVLIVCRRNVRIYWNIDRTNFINALCQPNSILDDLQKSQRFYRLSSMPIFNSPYPIALSCIYIFFSWNISAKCRFVFLLKHLFLLKFCRVNSANSKIREVELHS